MQKCPLPCLPLLVSLSRGLSRYASRRSWSPDELRGWKLFCLAPRMLLYRSPGGQLRSLPGRAMGRNFAEGRSRGTPSSRPDHASEAARARRAAALVHLGELSADGRALTADPLAAGGSDTLAELRSAAGPSGTNEHIRVLLDDEEDACLLHGAALRLANAEVQDGATGHMS
eukprot:s5209_g4.t1